MQFLIQRRIDMINRQILDALGNNRLNGNTKKWLGVLEKEGFKSDTLKNKINWYSFILFWYVGQLFILYFRHLFGLL